MTTLYCDSKGDRRFSALYAVVKLSDDTTTTIERYYQSVKRKADGTSTRKGEHVDHIVIHGKTYPPSMLTPLYKRLWEMYFDQNPQLLEYASQFDTFIDRFAGRAINTQAKVIEALVNKKRSAMNKGGTQNE